MQTRRLFWYLVLLSFTLTLVACGGRQSAQQQSAADAGLDIELAVEPDEPVTGEATLAVTVEDAEGNPVNDATVNVTGDMNHAGMVPVLAESDDAEDGVYTLPFEWTMGGDWIVTVAVTTADGETVEETFEYSVTAVDGAMDMSNMEDDEMEDMDGMEDDEMDMSDSDMEDMEDDEMDMEDDSEDE